MVTEKLKWLMLRVIYYTLLFFSILSGGLVFYIFVPISSYCFFGDFYFWKYIKYFPAIVKQMYEISWLWLTDTYYRGSYTQPITAIPSISPGLSRIKLNNSWQYKLTDCNGCIQCCEKITCPLLSPDKKYCMSYNTHYWKLFSCGRYPISQKQIDYYDCPK
ncbi:MAG: hypothetical protein QM487_03250 [Candidatus Marithrix sp.]